MKNHFYWENGKKKKKKDRDEMTSFSKEEEPDNKRVCIFSKTSLNRELHCLSLLSKMIVLSWKLCVMGSPFNLMIHTYLSNSIKSLIKYQLHIRIIMIKKQEKKNRLPDRIKEIKVTKILERLNKSFKIIVWYPNCVVIHLNLGCM